MDPSEFLDSEDEVAYYRGLLKEKRRCFVPGCITRTSTVLVKIRDALKKDWCDKVGVPTLARNMYCCEKHLNLQNDLENYGLWQSKSAHPKLKVTAQLKAFFIEEEIDEDVNVPSRSGSTSVVKVDAATEIHITMKAKGVQAKPSTKDVATNYRARKPQHNTYSASDSFTTSTLTDPSTTSTASASSSGSESSNNISQKTYDGRNHLLKNIQKNPKGNIGVPKHFYWMIKYNAGIYKTKELYVIMVLFKLKQNDTFIRLSEEFEVAYSTIQSQFQVHVGFLASYLQNFIFLPSPLQIKSTLPLVFRIRFSNVQMLSDCMEIEIEKPTNPITQAQTWSQYKSCNTVKYLVACTPSGFITFISKGYGGRISDKSIVQKSGFIDFVPTGAIIMADRGFKDIAPDLVHKNIKLLRPPSVYSNQKLSKKEVITSKVIASLRVHVERVIRRLREFKIVNPHSTVNSSLVKNMDEILIIVCGLVNLQNPIIKDY